MVNRDKEHAALKKKTFGRYFQPRNKLLVLVWIKLDRRIMESGFVHNVVMIKGRAIGSEEGSG